MQNVDHTQNIIEVKNVSFSYDGKDTLNDINLSIHRGDYIGLVGGNGAGKTTLIKIILGLLKPHSGTVKIFGTDAANFQDWSKIGYVPQKATHFDLNFPATAFEVVLMGRYGKRGLFRRTTALDLEKTSAALNHVGMLAEKDRMIGNLSGGQQQRIFIARALASEPQIVFLDEPTVGVEKKVREDFYALLRTLNEKLGLTIVLVTHDIESMTNEAMHIAYVNKTLTYYESIRDFIEKSKLIETHHA